MPLLLSDELECLKGKIHELEGIQKKHAKDMKEALDQSSETWHDNAPRDAILEAANITSNSLERLTRIVNDAVVSAIENDEFIIGLWTKFILDDGQGETTEFQITGTQNFLEIENGLPYDSPLGKIVYGKEFYDMVQFRGTDYTINPA